MNRRACRAVLSGATPAGTDRGRQSVEEAHAGLRPVPLARHTGSRRLLATGLATIGRWGPRGLERAREVRHG